PDASIAMPATADDGEPDRILVGALGRGPPPELDQLRQREPCQRRLGLPGALELARVKLRADAVQALSQLDREMIEPHRAPPEWFASTLRRRRTLAVPRRPAARIQGTPARGKGTLT